MSTITKGLRHKTIASAAAEEIRTRILNGDFAPGLRLRQEELAQGLGISRIPIREALMQLENEALVRILPHRGAVVVQLSAAEIEELFAMRMLLEPYLFERSAPHLTQVDFLELEKLLDEYETSISEYYVARWNKLNTDFHLLLYKHAHSSRIVATVEKLLSECERHTRLQLSNIAEDRRRAVHEHRLLLEYAKLKEYGSGAALIHAHIDHIKTSVVQLLSDECERTDLQAPD